MTRSHADAPPVVAPRGVSPAWRTATLVLSTGVAIFAAAAWHHGRAERDGAAAVREVAPAVPPDPRLGRVLDRVDFDGVSRGDAAVAVGRLAGLNVVAGWTLDDAAEQAAVPVSLHLRGVTAAAALDAVLADPAWSSDRLGWAERGGVVTVAVRAKLDDDPATVVVRAYDVRPLLDEAARAAAPGWPRVSGLLGDISPVSPPTGDDFGERLRQLLEQHVDPESWVVNGGSVGQATVWAGQLLVRQTERNQRAVEGVLRLLSARRAG